MADTVLKNSVYNKIYLLDTRPDTSILGVIQRGVLNAKKYLVTRLPLATQFSDMLANYTDSTAKSGVLLLNLRQLSYREVTRNFIEKGYFHFHANLYAKTSQRRLIQINEIDTIIIIKSAEVTPALLRSSFKTISDFIIESLTVIVPEGQGYFLNEVINIDVIEKKQMPLYTNDTLKDGLYRDYTSFKNQQPEAAQLKVNFKHGEFKDIAVIENGKEKHVSYKDYYALVYKAQPYIITEFGKFPLKKEKNNFIFTGLARISNHDYEPTKSNNEFAPFEFEKPTANFVMKIDHLTGEIIYIKQLLKAI